MKKIESLKIKKSSALLTAAAAAVFAFAGVNGTNVVKADATNPAATVVNDGRTATVVAHYQDEAGNKIADDQTIAGHTQVSYGTMRKAIPGYTLKDWQGPTEGYFEDTPKEVIYIYTKDNGSNETNVTDNSGQIQNPIENPIEKPGTSSDQKDPSKDKKDPVASTDTAKKDENKSDNVNTTTKDPAAKPAVLPQTGSDKTNSLKMLLAGVSAVAVSLLGMVAVFKKRI